MRRRLVILCVAACGVMGSRCSRHEVHARPDPLAPDLETLPSAPKTPSAPTADAASTSPAPPDDGPWSDLACIDGVLAGAPPIHESLCGGLGKLVDSYNTTLALQGPSYLAHAPKSLQCDKLKTCTDVESASKAFAISLDSCFGPEWKRRNLTWGRRWDRGRVDANVDGAIYDPIDPITCAVTHYKTSSVDGGWNCLMRFTCTMTDYLDEDLHGDPTP